MTPGGGFYKIKFPQYMRTNNIYEVTVKRAAFIHVEADSPEQAMELANKHIDDYMFYDHEFDEPEVDCCDNVPTEVDDDWNDILTSDGRIITPEEYINEMGEEAKFGAREKVIDPPSQMKINFDEP